MKRRSWNSFFNSILPAVFFGALTGVFTSLVVNLYKLCAKHVIAFSEKSYHFIGTRLYLIPVILLLLFAFALLFAYIYKRIPNLRGGGIPTSIGILRDIIPFKWVRNLIGTFGLSLLSFLIGVPLGNEGPSVQMGTAIGRGSVYSFGKKHRAWDRYSMTGGACSGFAVTTGAPISGILFAVEEAHQRITPMILMIASTSVMFASLTTELIAPILGVSRSLFPALKLPALSLRDVWIPVLLGVVMGLFAVLFLNYYKVVFKFSNKILGRIPHGLRIFSLFLVTFAFGLLSFSFVSTGHELILDIIGGGVMLLPLVLLLVVRSTLTLYANSNSITGGIFLPLMAVGALFSAVIATLFRMTVGLDSSYYTVMVVFGIVACIAGMMKMPLTAIVFAIEALSCYENVLFVIITAGIAFVITEIFGVESINDRVLENRVTEIHEGKEQQLLDGYVTVGKNAFAQGMNIRDIFWPSGTFVLSHKRVLPPSQRDKHAIKAIHEGDILHIRCTTYDADKTREELCAILGSDAANLR